MLDNICRSSSGGEPENPSPCSSRVGSCAACLWVQYGGWPDDTSTLLTFLCAACQSVSSQHLFLFRLWNNSSPCCQTACGKLPLLRPNTQSRLKREFRNSSSRSAASFSPFLNTSVTYILVVMLKVLKTFDISGHLWSVFFRHFLPFYSSNMLVY